LDFSAWLHQLLQDVRVAKEHAEEAIALSSDHGFVFWLLVGMILHGWSLAAGGQMDDGIAEIRQGLTGFRATGAQIMLPYYMGILAQEVYRLADQETEGLNLLAEAQAAVQNSGECWWEPELYRLKGELILAQSRFESLADERERIAEDYFNSARRIASFQGAKSLELRAVISLSRLRSRQGKSEAAREVLAKVYDRFTEGYDTLGLQEAKTLLQM